MCKTPKQREKTENSKPEVNDLRSYVIHGKNLALSRNMFNHGTSLIYLPNIVFFNRS